MFFTTTWPDCPIRICAVLAFCALSLVGASAQQPPPSSPEKEQKISGRSVIRGRVIYADTGRPLRRAEVSLVAQDSEIWSEYSITDRNGEFLFSNINAGKYFVLVNAPDIVSPLQQTGRASLNLKIALGQIEDGFSEVTVDGRGSVKTEIRASRGGVITGRVMSEIDEPIAKAQIKLFQIESGRLRPASATESPLESDKWMFETDSRGIYRIAGLATGEYVVRASESNERGNPDDAAEGSYTDGSMMVAFHPKALRVQDATSVKVQKGSETRDVDIRFTERIGHLVSGTVTVGGKAARGAEIRLTRDEPEVESFRIGSDQAQTDSDGRWEIRSVPDGNYTLWISGLVIGLFQLGDERGYATVAPLRRELIVAGTDVTDLKFELVAGGTLSGVVTVEGGTQLPEWLMIKLVSPDLSSRDPALKPLTNEESKSSEAPDTDAAVGSAFVKEKGLFSISQLPSGLFQFRLSGLGTGHYVKSITLNGKDLLRNPVKIEAGKTLNGVRIVLSSELLSLSGRAVEKGDRAKPLTSAAVLLFPVEVERRRISEVPITARTDKEGRFVVKGAPGDYFVFVFDRRRKDIPVVMPTEARLIKNASTLQKISLQRGDEKRIVEVVGP